MRIGITLTNVQPYDGRYDIDLAEAELTNREFGWIKRFAGVLPATIGDALVGGDAEFWCAVAVIALRRAGRIGPADAPAVFEKLNDAGYGDVAVQITPGEEEDAAAGPPVLSSTSSGSSSGDGSPTSSETRDGPLSPTGSPASDTSESPRLRSAS
jgi:hypothetical protein